jgi:hypothetical protein
VLRLVAPAVAAELRVPPPRALEVWKLSTPVDGHAEARVRGDRIELGLECDPSLGGIRWILAHEVAHWCLQNDPLARWRELPQLAQERLAEALAFQTVPGAAPLAAAQHRSALSQIERFDAAQGAFSLSAREWGEIAEEGVLRALYALGFLLALRIGPAGLAELCEQAQAAGLRYVPGPWLLERAGLVDAPPSALLAALEEQLALHAAGTP